MSAEVIRAWRASDIPAVASLETLLMKKPWNESMLKEELENADFFGLVCEIDNHIAGYAGFYRVADYAEIGNIAVAPDFQRRGVGTRLLTALFELAKEKALTSITLEVSAKNEGAKALYARAGFHEEGRRKNYYGAGDDALILWKRLD